MSHHEIEEAASFLATLVRIPSLTLAERQPAPDARHGEAGVVLAIAGYLRQHGLDSWTEEIERGRPQLWCRIGEGSPEILLTSHTDTVAPVDWPHDPFEPRRDGDRLIGLGTCDDKGSLTAMLLALTRLASRPLRGTVTFIAMVGEESFGVGSRRLMADGYRPDAAVVGEPTELRLVRVECGNIRWCFHTRGRAGHGSRPWDADNAIYRMADALRLFRDEIAPGCQSRVHPLAGPAAFNLGLIEGGAGVNIVPDRCTAVVERRILPWEDPLQEMESINARLREVVGDAHLEIEPPFAVNYPLDTPEVSPVVRSFQQALSAQGLTPEATGVSFGSDANRLAAAGVPAVIFGPGSIRHAHTSAEFVDLNDVVRAARVLEEVVLDFIATPGLE